MSGFDEPAGTAGRVSETEAEGPQAFRWRLVGVPCPPITMALPVGVAARAAVYRAADACGLLPLPHSFHRASSATHSHAFWLPEDADEDGLIDHVLVFASSGLPEELIPVLATGGEIFLAGVGRWRLRPDWMGHRVPGAFFGPARGWGTATPYVTPLWRSRKAGQAERQSLSPESQLRREIARRLLPASVARVELNSVIRRGSIAVPASEFSFEGRGGRRRAPPPDARATGVQLWFDQPVWGPLAFGFGAHFGLGLFEPVHSQECVATNEGLSWDAQAL